ncbi:TRAP-type uncharacterized transport system, substrate-binding protein [Amphritea atlantica]|uniref:TRAP-type uncharacterized transport system, substrate-binding protein n=1 Tax=Amphritea atlantica TaxID=355243 RepID=A0A1H9K1I5_9GAMM|nr:hypothetical protein [Amphritea atlantica]SEQ92837.1 TRAP-type uncharacterized transport system, substrate-binding protein [Amphritea atlantica]
MNLFKALGCLTLLGLTTMASATDVKVGTGSESGNYYSMVKDIKAYCDDALENDAHLLPVKSDGSVENLLGMNSKQFSMGVVQEDVLQYFAKTEPRKVNGNRMKVIDGMHMESLHLLIPKGYQPEGDDAGWKAMWSGLIKDEKPKPISLNLLKGQTVGSWGGSVISAKALSYFMGLNLNVVEIPADKRSNPNMPLVLVGGHPYKPVEQYLASGKYHLVAIDFAQLAGKAPFYIQSSVSYRVDGKIQSVPTFGVRALLIGKSFRKEERNANMVNLANCITDSLIDLADDPDTNPNWASVYELEEAGEQTNWNYFSLSK